MRSFHAFGLPRWDYVFRGVLANPERLHPLQVRTHRTYTSAHALPPRTCTTFLHLTLAQGGVGCPDLALRNKGLLLLTYLQASLISNRLIWVAPTNLLRTAVPYSEGQALNNEIAVFQTDGMGPVRAGSTDCVGTVLVRGQADQNSVCARVRMCVPMRSVSTMHRRARRWGGGGPPTIMGCHMLHLGFETTRRGVLFCGVCRRWPSTTAFGGHIAWGCVICDTLVRASWASEGTWWTPGAPKFSWSKAGAPETSRICPSTWSASCSQHTGLKRFDLHALLFGRSEHLTQRGHFEMNRFSLHSVGYRQSPSSFTDGHVQR